MGAKGERERGKEGEGKGGRERRGGKGGEGRKEGEVGAGGGKGGGRRGGGRGKEDMDAHGQRRLASTVVAGLAALRCDQKEGPIPSTRDAEKRRLKEHSIFMQGARSIAASSKVSAGSSDAGCRDGSAGIDDGTDAGRTRKLPELNRNPRAINSGHFVMQEGPPGMGLCLFTSRSGIKRGDVLLEEAPLLIGDSLSDLPPMATFARVEDSESAVLMPNIPLFGGGNWPASSKFENRHIGLVLAFIDADPATQLRVFEYMQHHIEEGESQDGRQSACGYDTRGLPLVSPASACIALAARVLRLRGSPWLSEEWDLSPGLLHAFHAASKKIPCDNDTQAVQFLEALLHIFTVNAHSFGQKSALFNVATKLAHSCCEPNVKYIPDVASGVGRSEIKGAEQGLVVPAAEMADILKLEVQLTNEMVDIYRKCNFENPRRLPEEDRRRLLDVLQRCEESLGLMHFTTQGLRRVDLAQQYFEVFRISRQDDTVKGVAAKDKWEAHMHECEQYLAECTSARALTP
ncbi:hypothetical protein CYMTET_5681 [Cymbomonas tetramitiformis]|uniref:Uncharacterized protein n=1 Tax=Cymbomonas tetramitiformis TaxID=36881 RepID=A0AAE0GYN9_9CHLO|nr:hypothetical protein CYMTET_5681 [Cymbomonas tetramitiformis]